MSKVFVLDTNKRPLNPVHPGQARRLLNQGKAATYRRYPFTIILKKEVNKSVDELRLKIDPGAKTTGLALVNETSGEVVWAGELNHRGFAIRDSLELVRFEPQLMQNPNLSGVEYQQGELVGYEVREYLLEKFGRQCMYCGAKDTRLEIEHLTPRSKGGSNRVSNLGIACQACNQEKGSKDVLDYLKGKQDLAKKILSQAKKPLADAAAVNATRFELLEQLKLTGLPVECGSGGLTKFNRTSQNLDKTHWLDAACVGTSTLNDTESLRASAGG